MPIWPTSSGRTDSPHDQGRFAAVFITLALLLVVGFFLSCFLGSTQVSVVQAVLALFSGDVTDTDFLILFHYRLPRCVAAVLAGSALAVSGVLIQAVLHNPMAAPNVIGVNSGAGLAASVMIAVFPNAMGYLPLAAFLGALAASLLIYAIASRTGAGKLTITLIGIAVGSVLNAGINSVKVLFPDSVYDADVFMIGGFSGVTYSRLSPAWSVILLGIILAFLLARDTDMLSLGEVTASSLGVHIPVLRLMLLVIASALAGAAVSFAGLLGFVGLLVPHIMRRFVGTRHRLLIPSCAMLGGLMVLACDIVSRTLFAPYEFPVGIVLSLVGGCFFIGMVLSGKRGVNL